MNSEIAWKCRIGLFGRRAICSWMREAVLKLTMDYKMTKRVLNNGTLTESRTWLLVLTWHCHFISFNSEHPVVYSQLSEQTAYDINHTELCCVRKHLWSRCLSKIPHSLRSCVIFKKPLDHKYVHTSIVQYCLTLARIRCFATFGRTGGLVRPPPPWRFQTKRRRA